MPKIELLSPAGDMDSLVAAVRTGADAVYLGLWDFNARRNAGNFTAESFAQAARYCRVRGVKVYVALNTLVRDDEMERAANAAVAAARAGADAFIVQDLGLARVLRTVLPDIPLHVSTQMAANSPAALPYLKMQVFNRAVAARELSKEQLRDFCSAGKACGVETEAFVHGALCVCLSGQCYLSAAIGGRSANRGMCAGSCRLPFGLKNSEEYALSLKDLSLISHIEELTAMGVASLKIEGRMKDAEYVAAATAVCRAAIDGKPRDEKLFDLLSRIFSRSGFTSRYFTGFGSTMRGVRTAADAEVSKAAKAGIHELYRVERGRVALSGKLTVSENSPARLTLSDGKHMAEAAGDIPQAAVSKPLTAEYARDKLSKTGETPFVIERLDCDIADGLALSASALNQLRRTALDEIENYRARLEDINIGILPPAYGTSTRQGRQRIYARFECAEQIPDEPDVDGIIIPAGVSVGGFSGEIIAEVPRRLLPEEEIIRRLEICRKNGVKKALCNNLQSVEIAKKSGFIPVYGWFMNVFNSYALKAAGDNGAKEAVLSFELSLAQAGHIKGNVERGLLAYGRLPLMLLSSCPKDGSCGCGSSGCGLTLTDRTKTKFPVLCADGARELLNSKVLWMADRAGELEGYDFLVLYFTTEDKNSVRQVIEDFKAGENPPLEFTRGLYYRAVK